MKSFKSLAVVVPVALALAVSLLAAFTAGTYVGYAQQSAEAAVDFSTFWRAWQIVDDKYVPTGVASSTKISSDQRVWGAISGMVNSLGDPYSTFFPPGESKMFEQEIRGNFGGVGMEVGMREGVLTVIAPLKNSPADKAGILAGDKIIKIDGREVAGMHVDGAIQLIRGDIGTSVKITIVRGGDDKSELEKTYTLKREQIVIPTIDTKKLNANNFLITIHNFSAGEPALFQQAVKEFVASRANSLLIDVRGNPGGYLEAAIDTASWFLPKGETVLIEKRGNAQDTVTHQSKGYTGIKPGVRVAVLVDGGSASASEILAGALADHGRATLVGEKTFGKGSVQELVKLPGNTALKITVARWLTPKSVSLSEHGLEPTVHVPALTDEAELDKARANPLADPVVMRAIKELR